MPLLRIVSDIHLDIYRDHHNCLENGLFESLIPHHEDDKKSILILAGDILSGKDLNISLLILIGKTLSKRFRHTFMVLGNHDYWHTDIPNAIKNYKKIERENVSVLENETGFVKDLYSYRFVGCTLWTDFDKGNQESMEYSRQSMVDYRYINQTFASNVWDKIDPDETYNRFQESKRFLKKELSKTSLNNVVITHHLPSLSCIDEKYKGSKLNGAFASDLDSLIIEHSPKLWVSGHTHTNYDFMIDKTRLLCNPKGYVFRSDAPENPNYNPFLFIKV